MARKRRRLTTSSSDTTAWGVVDDFPAVVPVTDAELDAIEAFLMPAINAIMEDSSAAKVLESEGV